MNTQKITSLLSIGQLAIDIYLAEAVVALKKADYYDRLHEFNVENPDQRMVKLDPRDEQCSEIIEFSKAKYAAVKAAKRKVYNIKRRINVAIRNSGLGAADVIHAVLDAERGEI